MAKKQTGKAGDRHRSGFMVRLPEEFRAKLQEITKLTRRTMTVEVQIALERHFAALAGKKPLRERDA